MKKKTYVIVNIIAILFFLFILSISTIEVMKPIDACEPNVLSPFPGIPTSDCEKAMKDREMAYIPFVFSVLVIVALIYEYASATKYGSCTRKGS